MVDRGLLAPVGRKDKSGSDCLFALLILPPPTGPPVLLRRESTSMKGESVSECS